MPFGFATYEIFSRDVGIAPTGATKCLKPDIIDFPAQQQ